MSTIGAEAIIPANPALNYRSIVNFRPGNGEAVTTNPPRFSWSYTPDPRDCFSDNTVHQFVFQIADEPTFASPDVEIETDCNFYNFLAPLAEDTWYWRVGYCGPSDFDVDEWSAVRSFTIAGDTPEWDRSDLADEVYLAAKAAHPHILFTSANKAALHSYLQASQTAWYNAFRDSYADAAIATDWWIEERMPTSLEADEVVWASRIIYVSLFHALTGDAKYDGVAVQLVLLAGRFTDEDLALADEVSDARAGVFTEALALGYDWCYSLLDSGQKATVLAALALRCDKVMNINRAWKDVEFGPTTTQWFSLAKKANAHGALNFINSFVAALSAYGEDATCRAYFDLVLNYMIGVTLPYGYDGTVNQGRGYLPADLFTSIFNLRTHMLAALTFTEAALETNPFWTTLSDWFDRFVPVGSTQIHDAWGDSGTGAVTYWGGNGPRALALFTGSGRAERHYQNQLALPPYSGDPGNQDLYTISFPYFFSTPTPATTSAGNVLYPEGFAIGSSATPSTAAGFESAVGFIFLARPCGGQGHDHRNDLSFQLWAHGAQITDTGAGFSYYAKIPYAHNTLLINGLGTIQPFETQPVPVYSRFIAWKEGADYLYVAADATNAYPRTSFTPGGDLIPGDFITNHTGAPLAALTKVHRHILFVRGKYWVILDDLASGDASTFSWLYHIHPNTATIDGSAKSFHYTVENLDTDDVTVYVKHIAGTAGLTLTDLTGTDVASNPITEEDYYAFYGDSSYRAHAIWISNTTPATSHKFLTVIYPVAPGGDVPTITRMDDNTVQIECGADNDIISFNPATAAGFSATLIVDLEAITPDPMADNLVLNQTANSSPVTELWKRAALPVTDPNVITEEIIHHSGDYPRHPDNGYAYTKHGTTQKHVFVFAGTLTLGQAIAARP